MKNTREAAFTDQPQIAPLQPSGSRPFWSVMIPAYNPRPEHLEQALKGVLIQDPGPEQMQIEVVDDCSPDVDVAALVKRIAGERVAYSRNDKNLGLAGAWNSCIGRSKGVWVHILHQDDYVSPSFYERLQSFAASHPEVGLLATRSFIVDGDGTITGATGRLPSLENGGNAVEGFFYMNPIQCPGVVVRRSCYERGGGFRTDLKFTLDCEMWARVIHADGGLVTSEVLSYYRTETENQSRRLWRTGEALADVAALNALFSGRYQGFDAVKARRGLLDMARIHEQWMLRLGDIEASRACREYWRRNATVEFWFEVLMDKVKHLGSRTLANLMRGLSKLTPR